MRLSAQEERAKDAYREREREIASVGLIAQRSSWTADFEQLEANDFAPVLNEKQLMSQIGEATLGKEIVSEVDGHAGIFSKEDRIDLA